MVAGQATAWLRRRKVQLAFGLACGLVLVPAAHALLQPPAGDWFWPIASVSAEACLALLLAFDVISLLVDREVERARAAGGLDVGHAVSGGDRGTPGRGIVGYARRVAARRELAYKALKADIALLAAEGVVSRSFSEIADDMGAAGYKERQIRQLVARAREEGLLERVEGKHRFRVVAATRGLPGIGDAVRARLPGLAEEPPGEATAPARRARGPSRQARQPSSSPASRPGPHDRPAWVEPGGDAGGVPGLVPAVLRRLRLAGRPVTLYPRLDSRTAVACIVAKRHADRRGGAEQVTAVIVPANAEVDAEKLRQVAAARHRLSETARSISLAMPGAEPQRVDGDQGLADGARVLVERELLEKEFFYLCAEGKKTWVFVRRAEVRRARVPEVSVLKGGRATGEGAGAGA
ncbi:MAG: hypothetical protein JW839_13445 [Candidatus Lokiarchaeota archaeon]|nr:hypothetical protein [Candidatus Lokiarchaeota archaeon]